MASKTFSLGEDGSSGCTKILLILLLGVVIVAAIVIGCFTFQASGDGCDSPKMDVNGLSNYSTGAKTIALSCFPGFFVDEDAQGRSNMVMSQCINKQWKPEPPTCNFLPLRLDCKVDEHGLDGRITIIQMDIPSETSIYGLIRYQNAIKNEGHINEVIPLSRHTPKCEISQQYNISGEIDALGELDEEKYLIKVLFISKNLKAYKMAEIHFAMVYLDVNTTASLISVHQGNVTIVMPNKFPRVPGNSSSDDQTTTPDNDDSSSTIITTEPGSTENNDSNSSTTTQPSPSSTSTGQES